MSEIVIHYNTSSYNECQWLGVIRLEVNVENSIRKSTHSTPRHEARGMLSLPAGRQGLILSGAFT
jgi:hypothetical protein